MSGDVITVAVTCDTCSRSNENTPLIRHEGIRTNVNYFYIFVLMSILLGGFSIGCYLMYKDKEWDDAIENIKNYPIILKAYSMDMLGTEELLPLDLPVRHIHLLELPDHFQCYNKYDCLLEIMTERNDSLNTYNFLVDNKSTIYEDLGWNYRCTGCDQHTVAIAIFNIYDGTDSTAAARTVSSILDNGIRSKKLDLCFTIYAVGNSTNFKKVTNDVIKVNQRSIECFVKD